jgi:hypothetical protein
MLLVRKARQTTSHTQASCLSHFQPLQIYQLRAQNKPNEHWNTPFLELERLSAKLNAAKTRQIMTGRLLNTVSLLKYTFFLLMEILKCFLLPLIMTGVCRFCYGSVIRPNFPLKFSNLLQPFKNSLNSQVKHTFKKTF